jgi:hypothetical protein
MFKRVLVVLVTGLLAAACTTQSIQTTNVTPPPEKYSGIVVGKINATKPELEKYVPFFRTALLQQLRKEEGIATVLDDSAAVPPGAFMLTGALTDVDLGNAAARFIIGFGAGGQTLSGEFEMRSGAGAVLSKFASQESYAGGAGIGGVSMLSLEEFTQKFGVSTGEAVGRWARGEPLQRSNTAQK